MITPILILWILYALDAPGTLVMLGWINFVACAYHKLVD